MAPKIMTATGGLGNNSTAEYDRELLSIEAEIASLETRKANIKAQRMDALFLASMSDTKESEDTLMAALVDANKMVDEDLHGVLKRLDDQDAELAKMTRELFGRLMKRRIEVQELIDRNENGGFCMPDTKNREDTLTAALVDETKMSDEDLYGTLERLDNYIIKLTKRTEALFEGLRRRKREIKGLVDANVSGECCVFDGLVLRFTDGVDSFKYPRRFLMGRARPSSRTRMMGMMESSTKRQLLRMTRKMGKSTKHQLLRTVTRLRK
jgi:hypothetical protein